MSVLSKGQAAGNGSKGPGAARWVRRGLAIAAAIVLVLWLGVQLAANYFVNADNLREQIAQALYENTGFHITIGGEVGLAFRPLPTISLADVTIMPADKNDHAPILKADAISGTVDLLSTIFGNPALSRVSLKGADLHFASYSDGHSNIEPKRPEQSPTPAADEPQAAPTPTASETAAPAADETAGDAPRFLVKELVFVDSSLEIVKDGAATVSLQHASGNLSWPAFDKALSFNVTADYRGKTLTFAGQTSQAASLVRGGLGQLRFSVRSNFLNADFSGLGNFSATSILDGDFDFESKDLSELFVWLGDPMRAPIPIRTLNASAKLKTKGTTLTLEALQLSVDDIPAKGAIEIGLPPGDIPSLKGTLAFETFDIYGFLSTFTPIPMAPNGENQRINTGLLRRLKLDLRLSATSARYGPIHLDGMAASARIEDRFASFDIAAARFAGASVTARLTLDERDLPKRTAGLRLDTGKINLATLAETLGLSGPLPDARGNISAELSADLPFWAVVPADVSGMMRVTTGAGNIRNFDVDVFREQAAKGNFFNLSEASDGTMAYRKFVLDTRIENGVVEVVNADVSGERNHLTLKGVIPYRNQSLALTGTLSKADEEGEDIHFFAGGAWPDIVITPVDAVINPATEMQDKN